MKINELNFIIKHISRSWMRSLSDFNISEQELQVMSESFILSEYRYCDPVKTLQIFGIILTAYKTNKLTSDEIKAFGDLHRSCKDEVNKLKTTKSIKVFIAENKNNLQILWYAAKYNRNVAQLQSAIGHKIKNELNAIQKCRCEPAFDAKSLAYSVVLAGVIISSVLIYVL